MALVDSVTDTTDKSSQEIHSFLNGVEGTSRAVTGQPTLVCCFPEIEMKVGDKVVYTKEFLKKVKATKVRGASESHIGIILQITSSEDFNYAKINWTNEDGWNMVSWVNLEAIKLF